MVLTAPEARKQYISISTVGITAFTLAMHEVILRGEAAVEKALISISGLDWSRTTRSVFYGTVLNADLANPEKLVTSTSRTGFETGADRLITHLRSEVPQAVA